MTNAVIQLHPLADDAALALLKGGQMFESAAEFGRRCGWNRQKAHRRLKEWTDSGRLSLEKNVRKIAVVTHCPRLISVSADTSAPVSSVQTEPPSCHNEVQSPSSIVPIVRHNGVTRTLLGSLLIFSGVCLGLLSFFINAKGWSAFAQTASASVTLAGLGLLFDILAIVLPSAASNSKWRYAAALWGGWAVIAGTVFCTNIGFAYGNIGDSVQGRSASMDRRAVIQQRLVQWRRDRSEIPLFAHTKDEDVATATASRIRECDIKRFCSKATETELKVRAHRGFTVRAEKLDTDIAALELELKELPIVASADPQIAGTLKVMSWVFLSPSEDLAAVIRLLIIAGCLSFFPGLAVTAGFDLLRS